MTTLREAAEMALEALELEEAQTAYPSHFLKKAMGVVRTALAIQTVPSDCSDSHQPVAWMVYTQDGTSAFVTANPKDFTQDHRALPLYTAPPQRKPIDAKTLWEMWVESPSDILRFARAIERAHGIGGKE
jgi:hypothetical protein